MVKAPKPPISLRVPQAIVDRVEKWATARGIPRNAAYVKLLDRGLATTGAKKLANVAKADAAGLRSALKVGDLITGSNGRAPARVAAVQFGPTPVKPGSRLKGSKK